MKMNFQFEADADGNVLWGEADDGFKIIAKVKVPDGASEDYGYLALKREVLFELDIRELDIEVSFPYDGQEQHLDPDANDGTEIEIDVQD